MANNSKVPERIKRLRKMRAEADSASMKAMYGKNGTERRKKTTKKK